MVGDFILRVDSVVGSAACVDSSRCGKGSLASYGVASAPGCSVSGMTNGDGKNCGEVVECRICQEEGDECDLESPCACTGTLKFAHRKCIQKWCNKKGNITCEICNQAFAPDYVSPSSEIGLNITTIDIRRQPGARSSRHAGSRGRIHCTQPYPAFCKRLFPGFEPVTFWSYGNNFTVAPRLPFYVTWDFI